MVSIHSAEENDFVAQLGSSTPRLWLGGKRDCLDCSEYWTDGTPWDFETWIPGNPSKDGVNSEIYLTCCKIIFRTLLKCGWRPPENGMIVSVTWLGMTDRSFVRVGIDKS